MRHLDFGNGPRSQVACNCGDLFPLSKAKSPHRTQPAFWETLHWACMTAMAPCPKDSFGRLCGVGGEGMFHWRMSNDSEAVRHLGDILRHHDTRLFTLHNIIAEHTLLLGLESVLSCKCPIITPGHVTLLFSRFTMELVFQSFTSATP